MIPCQAGNSRGVDPARAGAGELVLRVTGPVQAGHVVRLQNAKCTIGSDPRCTLRASEPVGDAAIGQPHGTPRDPAERSRRLRRCDAPRIAAAGLLTGGGAALIYCGFRVAAGYYVPGALCLALGVVTGVKAFRSALCGKRLRQIGLEPSADDAGD